MENPATIRRLVPGNRDERREIRDITPRIKMYRVLQEGIELGNHFHRVMGEAFYVVDGEINFKLEDSRTGQRETFVLSECNSAEMPLLVAHKLTPRKGTIFLGYLDRDFNPADLNKYVIAW